MSRLSRFSGGVGLFRSRILPLAAVLLAEAASAQQPAADRSVLRAISDEVQTIFARSREAVVKVEASDRHGRLSGTGFFIDPNGTLYTSYTIGGASEDLVVRKGNQKYPARRLIADSRSGVAILKIEAETPFLPTGGSEGLKIASPVVAVGYPMDLPLSPSFGLVAGFDLKYLGRFFATTHIRATVPVHRGEGGAPLLDLKGNVVGILISSLESGNGCFALPIEGAEKVRRDYVRFGEVRPGWLGIDIGSLDAAAEGAPARIEGLLADTPAAASALRKGDVLLRVGEVPIASPADVLDAAFFLSAGDVVPLVVSRGGETVRVEIRVGERPAPSEAAEDVLHALSGPTPGSGLGLSAE